MERLPVSLPGAGARAIFVGVGRRRWWQHPCRTVQMVGQLVDISKYNKLMTGLGSSIPVAAAMTVFRVGGLENVAVKPSPNHTNCILADRYKVVQKNNKGNKM